MSEEQKKRKHKVRRHYDVADDRPSRFSGAIFFLLCAIPVLSTIAFGAVDAWAMGVLAIAAAIIALLWAAESWRYDEFRFSLNSLQIPILGLILIGLVQLLPFGNSGISTDLLSVPASNALSLDPYATRLFIVRLVTLFVFFAAALTFMNSSKRLKIVIVMLVIFGAVMAFFGILQWLANPGAIYGVRPTPQAIPFGPYVNQHHFAALMEMTSGLTIGLLFGSATGRDRKMLLAIAVVLMGMAIFLTGSRGGVLSYIGVIAFACLASFVGRFDTTGGRQRKLLIVLSVAGLILVAMGSVSFLGGGEALFRGLGSQAGQVDITSGRGHFWWVGWQIFLAHPIIGSGFDAFGVAFSRYDTWNGLFRVEQAHNDYLQILADAGILGFACVAAFVFLLLRNGIRSIAGQTDDLKRSIAVGTLAGCLGILIHSFFDFPLRTPANAFVFLMLAALATSVAERTKHSRKRPS
jgi:O-antigen ligase